MKGYLIVIVAGVVVSILLLLVVGLVMSGTKAPVPEANIAIGPPRSEPPPKPVPSRQQPREVALVEPSKPNQPPRTSQLALPTSQPTTAHRIADAQRELDQAKRSVTRARDDCLARLHASPAFKDASSKMQTASMALDKARAGSDVQARLDASSNYNHSRATVKKLEENALASDQTIPAAEERVRVLTDRLQKLEAKAQSEAENQRIDDQIVAEGKLHMTPEYRLQKMTDVITAGQKRSGLKLIETLGLERRNDKWIAKLTVTDEWHFLPKQIRLEFAQSLYRRWGELVFPDKPAIDLVDEQGNEVGGMRMLGGIWVRD